ncbi:hypothetical protein M3C61_10455 [Dermacoccus abyssi]|uniref:Uncharacterized protein n=1 Tax=Dermacoccus nishinomiyaensis TaxID=1274 RepID=A0A075JIW2_9MICO|nr:MULTISPECIES: hypothetical protein [Dermacoccus]AIF39853.1 hypothetical protein HX89_01355 [Dermacoccus nishinomiyaensis]MCI0154653.1 hypothetical protein [Dermacoccus nishinomiyaensis]MCT1987428.1 hypothetical protein [Dermacoccus abyssi]
MILESVAQVGYDTQAVVPGLQLHLDSVEVMIGALEEIAAVLEIPAEMGGASLNDVRGLSH